MIPPFAIFEPKLRNVLESCTGGGVRLGMMIVNKNTAVWTGLRAGDKKPPAGSDTTGVHWLIGRMWMQEAVEISSLRVYI